MRSSGVVREVLHQFKYEGKRYLLPVLEGWILQGATDPRLRDPPVEWWVPVPLHWTRLWLRGFNQAALLARAVARVYGGTCVEALRRTRPTGTQTSLERDARLHNVRGAIQLTAAARYRVSGREVALVDDVFTTGATAEACARALREAGARSVRVLTVARG
jgi:ComF family protein